MKDFLLEIIYTLAGIGAASGLVYTDNRLYLVSDDSNYLYEYVIEKDSLYKTLLVSSDSINEQSPKKQKCDFEAITFSEGQFTVYGSGSHKGGKRNLRITYSPEDSASLKEEDQTAVYLRLQEQLGINSDNFNIEGAIERGDTLLLFNRGNGKEAKNGVFRLIKGKQSEYFPISLPELNGIKAGFTDAVLHGNTVYFLAAAEGSGSVYHDGKIHGTLLGTLSYPSLEKGKMLTLSDNHKFEGITLFKENETEYTFLLCEDNDDGSVTSFIYSLKVSKDSLH